MISFSDGHDRSHSVESNNVFRLYSQPVDTKQYKKSQTNSKSGNLKNYFKILICFKIICNLEDYILEHCQYTARGRLGEILCLIPTLQAISCELVDTIQFSKILGYAEVDALINEMLLNRGK